MVWKRRAWTTGALLLCTSVVLAAAKPGDTAKSAAERAQILDALAAQGTMATVQPQLTAQPQLGGETSGANNQTVDPKPDRSPDLASDLAQAQGLLSKAMDQEDAAAVAKWELEVARLMKEPRVLPANKGPATCGDCSSAESDANLDPLPATAWGGSIAGDAGVNGHWMGEFTAVLGETIHFDLCFTGSSSFDSDIKILDASCAILSGVDGNSSCGWNADDFTFAAPANGTYYVVIAPYNSSGSHTCSGTASDTFTLAYYSEGVVLPSTNDDCVNADVVADGMPAAEGDNCAALTDLSEAGCQSNSNKDVWYEYTATCTGTVTADTENSGQGDTVLSVYDACSNGLEVACDDDGGTGALSLVSFEAIVGETYWIRLASFNNGCGDYDLNVSCAQASTGACCTAGACSVDFQSVCEAGGGTYLGDNTDCTGNPCAVGGCCFDDGSCSVEASSDCGLAGGSYSGDGSNCTPNLCPQPCVCDVTTGGFCTEFGDDAVGTTGLWSQSVDDDMDWTLNQGATGSSGTGPSGDHTTGNGFYAYMEATGPAAGDTAILDGPCVDLSTLTAPAVSFWYHMYGAAMGTLSLEVSGDNCLTWNTVWTLSGDQGDAWFFAQVDLAAYAGQTISVRFVGTIGSSFTSDIALDDICFDELQVLEGGCCDLDTGNCLGVMNETNCLAAGNTTWQILADCTTNNFCPQPPPANDLCADVTVVTALPFDDLNVNYGDATDDLDTSCNASSSVGTRFGVWYQYTPTSDCDLTVTKTDVGASQDTLIAIFTGPDCNNLTEIACSDPDTLSVFAQAGQTYWILVGRWSGSSDPTGNININIDCTSGACCNGGSCTIEPQSACEGAGGTFVGNDSICEANTCSQGACCFTDGSCSLVDSNGCELAGGQYSGDATSCTPNECPQGGDSCSNPSAISLPADLGVPFADSTCGRGNNFEDASDSATCMSFYTSGEDAVYELTVDSTVCVDVSLTSDTTWTGISIDDMCPPDGTCVGVSTSSGADEFIGQLMLDPGTYSVMIDTWATPACINAYTLTFDACPTGACCTDGGCALVSAPECAALGGVYAGDNTMCSGNDCNGNGSDDACEILEDPAVDCNGNAVPDDCDISSGSSMDCDGNGTPDECDLDCNGNGIIDGCDVSCGAGCASCYPGQCGLFPDCQGDGIPDDCQLGGSGARATQYLLDDGTMENALGVAAGADVCTLQRFIVVGGAETINSIEVAWGAVTAGSTGTVYLWNDPNGDGDPSDAQVLASAPVTATDPAGSAAPFNGSYEVYAIPPTNVGPAGTSFFVGFLMSGTEFPAGMDENGVLADESWIVGDAGFAIDPNDLANPAYNIPVSKFSAIGFPANLMVRANGIANGADCNTNGIPDECDIRDCGDPLNDPNCSDCDGNGTIDICEYLDCNNNGTHDACDILQGADDCDTNGVPDKCDPDCDGNDIPDACEADQSDCNANGLIDLCDIANGTSNDCQPDGVPDECQLTGLLKAVVLSEGFEGTVPPAGWGAVVTNAAFTWKAQTTNPPEGLQYADIEFDPALAPQDEWLLTPVLNMSGAVTVSGVTMGSVYWGVTPFDNYDVGVYVVENGVGGGDDTLLGLLDSVWVTNFVWENFSFNFTAPATDFQIGFRYTGSDGAQSGLDAIVVDGVAQAGPPANDCDGDGIPDDCQLCGDLDRDGDVDFADYQAFLAAFATVDGDPGFVYCYDFDGDGVIGLTDYRAWLECYRTFIGNPLSGPPRQLGNIQTQERSDQISAPQNGPSLIRSK